MITKNIKYELCILLILFGIMGILHGQAPISRGFDNLQLGMDFLSAQEALTQNSNVQYRGAPDVSMRPGTREPLLRALGRGFVDEVYLQFRNDQLYSLVIVMDEKRIDYFTFFQRFSSDYGNPQRFSPQRSIWEDGQTRLILEKPLIVQYIDIEQFDQILEEHRILDSVQQFSRDLFLDSF